MQNFLKKPQNHKTYNAGKEAKEKRSGQNSSSKITDVAHDLRARTCCSSACSVSCCTYMVPLGRHLRQCQFGLLNSMTKRENRMCSTALQVFAYCDWIQSTFLITAMQYFLRPLPCLDIAILLEKETQN